MRRLLVFLSLIFAAHAGLLGQAFQMQKLDEKWTLGSVYYNDTILNTNSETASSNSTVETRVYTREHPSYQLKKYLYYTYPDTGYEGETDVYIRPLPNHEEETISISYDPHSDTVTAYFRHRIEYEYARSRVQQMNAGDRGLCGTEVHRRLHEGHQPDVEKEISLEEARKLINEWTR